LLVAIWILCGAVLRDRFAIFDRIYVPPSVIAGFIGLFVVQLAWRIDSEPARAVTQAASVLKAWPATLIAVVFAGMLLPRARVPWRQSIGAAGREAVMVWIIVLGQTAVGLWLTWLLLQPFYELPNSFAMLIETGFAGGHGTAAAMGQVFRSPSVNMPEGQDLGLLMATVGLLYGTVSGIVWINLAKALGWVQQDVPRVRELLLEDAPVEGTREVGFREADLRDSTASAEQRVVERQTRFAKGLDPMLVQAIWLALALAVGFALQSIVAAVGAYATESPESRDPASSLMDEKMSTAGILGSFPLFIYAMLGGWLVRKSLKALRSGELIDEVSVARWTSMAMDLLVVAALATVDISALVERLVPFTVLAIGGMVWTAVCLLIISRHILPRTHWFQLGLINYGMSTGTTATGLVLLRIIDPELKTDAAKDYATAAPFSAPFIGGGMITIALPLVLLESVPIGLSAIGFTVAVVALILLGSRFLFHRT
jgi:ESS family glutamate:Na+ symporter